MNRARSILALAFGTWVLSGSAHADATEVERAPPARVLLEYRREPSAASCVSPEQLTRDVEARLGRPVFSPASDADLRARVLARRRAGRFVISITLFDRAGRRLGARNLTTLGPHCSSLDESLALVLSLAADVRRTESDDAPVAAAPDELARAPAPSAAPTVSLGTPISIPANTPAPRLGLRLEPSLGVALVSGLLPRLGYGLELGLTLRAPAFWAVSLRGTGWAGQRRERDAGTRGATFSAQTLEVGVCPWTEPLGGLALSVCALEWLGRGRARGFGFDEASQSEAWLFQLGAGATLTERLGPLFVSVSAAALVPVLRRRYYFTEGATDAAEVTLHEQPWLSFATALRVGIEI